MHVSTCALQARCLVANVVDFGLQGISGHLFCAILPQQLQLVLTLLGNLPRTADVAYIRRLLMTLTPSAELSNLS